uniref:C2H2-type domain-containing protein n=1 Tax=Eptatretus burgeri TaxID=7764 RepID=A0A8C4QTH9_EPTBU
MFFAERHENLVDKFACTLCRHSFNTKAALQVHVERHQWASGDEEYKRIQKGGQTSTRTACGKRINLSANPKKRVRSRAGERPYRCKYCVKTFSYQPNLIRHMCICVGEKPYACTVCGKGFSWPSHCQLHMRMHTGERPYMCTICLKGFSRSSNCQIHMQTHKGERPYTCTVCGKGFSRSSNCQTHMRTHTGERPYNCSVCARTFSYQSALRNHLRTHTGEKPYICNVCGKGFSQLPTCQRHMRLHAGENYKSSFVSHACTTISHYKLFAVSRTPLLMSPKPKTIDKIYHAKRQRKVMRLFKKNELFDMLAGGESVASVGRNDGINESTVQCI